MLSSLLLDENFNHRILHGLVLRLLDLDYVAAQEIELKGKEDSEVLIWAAGNDRIIVTHDVETMPKYAYEHIAAGRRMPGVIVVPQSLPIGPAESADWSSNRRSGDGH